MLKNKKIIYLILYILLFVGVNFSTLVYAVTTGTVYLTTNKDSYENEENIELSINIKDIKTAAYNVKIYFDDDKLEYVSGPENINVVGNQIIIVWYDLQGGIGAKEGELDKIIFKAKDYGICNFVIEGEFYSEYGQLIQTDFKECQVKIGESNTTLLNNIEEEEGISNEPNNANLQILRLNIEGIVPNFNNDVLNYYLTVTQNISNIEILAIPENVNATVEIEGNTNLKIGLNNIKIKVISEDKTQSKVYNIEVTKTVNLEDANTNLETLAIENVLLNPAFENNITQYNCKIANNQDSINILAIPEKENASVKIEGQNNLKEGENIVKIIVTAPNGFTKKEIEIKVYRRNTEEEKIYQEEQSKMEEKLEKAYEIEKVSSEITNNSVDEKNRTNNYVFLVIISLSLIVGVVFIYYKNKKNRN